MKSVNNFRSESAHAPSADKDEKIQGAEFDLVSELIAARIRAGLTQKAVAARMGILQSNVSRLESGQLSPTIRTIQSYAQALGFQAVVRFEPVA
jgi:ribosome-binding protein aMBF1 (putative translation factor)